MQCSTNLQPNAAMVRWPQEAADDRMALRWDKTVT